MRSVNVHEAKAHLSRLLADVGSGEEITISRNGRMLISQASVEGLALVTMDRRPAAYSVTRA